MSNTAWPFYPLALLHDSARCLALVNQDQLQLNPQSRLQIGGVSCLTRAMLLRPQASHPRSESQAPGLSLLIGLLMHAGLVTAQQRHLQLTAAAHQWLDLPAALQLTQLRQVWWSNPAANTRWFPATRRQRPLDSLWHTLTLETARWVAGLCPREWARAADLQAYLADRDLLGPAGAGRNLPSVHQALQAQSERFVDFLLRFPLPYLGLIELSDPPERCHLRPTPEGAAWLTQAIIHSKLFIQPPEGVAVEEEIPHYELRVPPAEGSPVDVALDPAAGAAPALAVTVHLAAPAAHTFDVAHFAQLLSPGPPARYHVTLEHLRQATDWGYPPSDVIFLLARFCGAPLPPHVLAQLNAWRGEIIGLPCQPGYRITFAGPEILHTLRQREPFRCRTLPFPCGRAAWVDQSQSRDLFRYLRRMGYEPKLTAAPHDVTSTMEPLRRPPFPLLRWLVTLGTYQRLRQRLPGLSDVDLEDVEQALRVALPPDELAAAERLIASHDALLAKAITAPVSPDGVEEAAAPAVGTPGDDRDALHDRLEAAIQSGAVLNLTYADAKGRLTRRRVHPLHLETRWGQVYLVAFCELRQDERSFRLDRIVAVDDDHLTSSMT